MLEALRSCAPERENVVRSNRNPSNHEPKEIESNFISYFVLGALYFVLCLSWLLKRRTKYKVPDPKLKRPKLEDLKPWSYFLLMPRWMMLCISSEFGIPRSVAGLRPNGPPSVFALKVMLSPVA